MIYYIGITSSNGTYIGGEGPFWTLENAEQRVNELLQDSMFGTIYDQMGRRVK